MNRINTKTVFSQYFQIFYVCKNFAKPLFLFRIRNIAYMANFLCVMTVPLNILGQLSLCDECPFKYAWATFSV